MKVLAELLLLAGALQAASPSQPYIEEKTVLEYRGVRMPAVLTVPAESEPVSAILLVPGSLFSDVDGNYPAWNVRPHAYLDLARQLAARGHAVLRYSKIGPGTGSETFDEAAAAAHRHFEARVGTARAALDLLVERLAEAPVVVAGHSEGAVVTSLLAARDGRIRGVVSLSGPATGLFDIMREQIPPGTSEEGCEAFDEVVAELRAGRPLPKAIGQDPATVMFTRIDQRGIGYIVEVDAVDPSRAIAEVDVPVLVVQGGRDSSVRPHHAVRLAEARGDRPTASALFAELQHFYKTVGEGVDPMTAFRIETESDPAVAGSIDDWVRRAVVGR